MAHRARAPRAQHQEVRALGPDRGEHSGSGGPARTTPRARQPAFASAPTAASSWRWAIARRLRSMAAACVSSWARMRAGTKASTAAAPSRSPARTSPARRGAARARATSATARHECGEPSAPTMIR